MFSSPVDRREWTHAVFKAIMQQAELDASLEDAKWLLADAPLSVVFDTIDRFGKGHITDTDLWSFGQQFRNEISFGKLCALVSEVHLRRPRDWCSVPGRLYFRDFASLLLKMGTREYEELALARTDEEARSIDYVNGRDKLSDYYQRPLPLSVSLRNNVQRLLDVAANAAYELESTRKKLALLPGGDLLRTLSAVYTHISGGRSSMRMEDLYHSVLGYRSNFSQLEFSMLRHRYGKPGTSEVAFADFTRQLTHSTARPLM
jgi:hypothetical protein